MQAYLLTGALGDLDHTYFGTRDEAAAAIKKHLEIHPHDQPELRVELTEIATDKATIISMLNNEGGYQIGDPLRTWRCGPRGGLVECPNGE